MVINDVTSAAVRNRPSRCAGFVGCQTNRRSNYRDDGLVHDEHVVWPAAWLVRRVAKATLAAWPGCLLATAMAMAVPKMGSMPPYLGFFNLVADQDTQAKDRAKMSNAMSADKFAFVASAAGARVHGSAPSHWNGYGS